jgi:hypothetical protein
MAGTEVTAMRQWTAMMMAAMAATGCSRVQATDFQVLDSTGVVLADVQTQAGRVSYDGSSLVEEFRVDSTVWGTGSRRTRAEDRMNQARVDLDIVDRVFQASGSGPSRSGVDLDVIGPGVIDADVFSASGQAQLFNVEGIHTVEGSSVVARNVIGDATFIARNGGAAIEIEPFFDVGIVTVDARNGDVELGLPFGYDYDLTVTTDFDHTIAVEELGFFDLILDDGLVLGRAGLRTVRVDVRVENGDVFIYELR